MKSLFLKEGRRGDDDNPDNDDETDTGDEVSHTLNTYSLEKG